MSTRAPELSPRSSRRVTYCIEGLFSISGNMLFVGIFFYMTHQYRWGIIENFLLAMGQGLIYIVAALFSDRISRALGPRRVILFTCVGMIVVAGVGVFTTTALGATAVLLCYVPLLALNWPVLESMASADPDPHAMSRNIGVYNLVWSGMGALSMAIQGTIINIDPRGVFCVPVLIHAAAIIIVLCVPRYGRKPADETGVAGDAAHPHAEPEPELVRHRTLALWLSRIALPSTYVVIYSLSALMPLLPVVRDLKNPAAQTLLGSVWFASRCLAFLVLTRSTFWHTRPRLLLWAAMLTLVAFFGITLRASTSLGTPLALDIPIMAFWQAALGCALGLIYTASLYFGMVLSEGSTEHGGYHEALIGLGQVLGPAVGALTQWKWPGSLPAGVVAVGSIIALSVLAAQIAAIRAARQEKAIPPVG